MPQLSVSTHDCSALVMSAKSDAAAEQRDARDARWSALMAAAQGGDGRAYETLLRECLPLIRTICRARLRNVAEVDDAVQDTLLTLHKVRHTYDPCRPFRPWLAAVAEYRAIDRRRSAVGRASRRADLDDALDVASDEAGPDHRTESKLAASALRAAIADLPTSQRTALHLAKIEQLSLVEASARSGMSVSALKIATHRAIQTLRKRLGGWE